MKEKLVVNVQSGGMIQVSYDNRPVGQPIAIPQGVSSVTVIVRDAEGAGGGKGARNAGRDARRGGGGGGGGRRKNRDAADED